MKPLLRPVVRENSSSRHKMAAHSPPHRHQLLQKLVGGPGLRVLSGVRSGWRLICCLIFLSILPSPQAAMRTCYPKTEWTPPFIPGAEKKPKDTSHIDSIWRLRLLKFRIANCPRVKLA